MFAKLYQDSWQIIDPSLFTIGTCSAFALWLAIF